MLNPQPAARLEVWGDPVAHSRSPQLHTAAYRALGLDWSYNRRRVDERSFASELGALPGQWRGLSLTMPLKSVGFAAANIHDRPAELTGAVNTLLRSDDGPRGFNTDVGGMVRDLREQGLDGTDGARIVGGGATATSALVALGELGARHVEVVTRRHGAAAALTQLGHRIGIRVTGVGFDLDAYSRSPLTIAALPGGARVPDAAAAALAASGGVLYDVVYGHWPTALAAVWESAGARAVSGGGMLLHQALLQVRIFVTGDVERALPDEQVVLTAMRHALVGD